MSAPNSGKVFSLNKECFYMRENGVAEELRGGRSVENVGW